MATDLRRADEGARRRRHAKLLPLWGVAGILAFARNQHHRAQRKQPRDRRSGPEDVEDEFGSIEWHGKLRNTERRNCTDPAAARPFATIIVMRCLVIMLRRCRLDYLGCYGNDWIATPTL